MAGVQNNKNHRFNPEDRNAEDSHREHDCRMRDFRRSHAGSPGESTITEGSGHKHLSHMGVFRELYLNIPWPRPRRNMEPVIPERVHILSANYATIETGGKIYPIRASDWQALIPMWGLARRKISSN
ncbi:hypothetical protein ACFLVB_01300 [Chloroflexota bacterium]